MDNALLIGLSQQMAMRRQMDIIANNLANMTTTAFKSESVQFEEFPIHVKASEPTGRKLSFVEDVSVIPNLAEGGFDTTGGPLDLAISGNGFFTVSTADGPRYTRNGHFKLDADGRVVTNEGHPLLGAGGSEFTIAPGESAITISKDGSLSTSAGSKGRIATVTFANLFDLEKIGASLYATEQAPEPAQNVEVIQGALEQSNVQPLIEMTKMIEMVRSYQSVADLMQRADELSRQTIREMGQIPQA